LDLPSFTVYESIDLGVLTTLKRSSSTSSSDLSPLLESNFPTFQADPLYPGRIYISHAVGVHVIDTREWMTALFLAMQDEVTANVSQGIKGAGESEVVYLLNTLSIEDR
jgi:nucleoporin NUP82